MILSKYASVWLITSQLSLQSALENRLAAIFFLTGKLLRFLFFFIFIFSLSRQIHTVGSYSIDQIVIFFLVFNIFDLVGQIFFRGIYWFREQVLSGEFDFRLVKPMNSLFQVMTRQTDILDVPLLGIVIIMLFRQSLDLTWVNFVGFLVFTFAACLIITGIHIIVASLGVVTTEVDHTIMIYRDLSSMGRFPVDIYAPYVRLFLTFIVPIALAFTFPAKVLMGLVNPVIALMALFVAVLFFYFTLKLWYLTLRQYSSASS